MKRLKIDFEGRTVLIPGAATGIGRARIDRDRVSRLYTGSSAAISLKPDDFHFSRAFASRKHKRRCLW
jgi:hypothetical protein